MEQLVMGSRIIANIEESEIMCIFFFWEQLKR